MPVNQPPVNVENQTLAQYVTILNQIANDHAQISDFGFGPTSEISARENPKYPLLWVETQASTFDQKVITFKLRLYIIDQINKEISGTNSNALTVKSDTSTVLWDLVTILRDFYDVEPANSAGSNKFTTQATPFDNKFAQGLSGWYLDMSLVTPYTYGACDAPSNGQMPPGPRPVHPGFIGPVIYVGCTDSICLHGNGGPNDPILADLRISDALGNTAVVIGDGLFVPGSSGMTSVQSVTYDEIFGMATGSTLVPGQLYRITDYNTIYVQPESLEIMTGHNPFQLIVLAINDSKVGINAWAVPNSTFPNANLWQVEYDLFSTNVVWAVDPNSGDNIAKGSITRLVDENLNDCPYDFKNILFRRYQSSGYSGIADWVNGKFLTIQMNDDAFIDCYTFNVNNILPIDGSDTSQRNRIGRSGTISPGNFSKQVLGNNVFITLTNNLLYDNIIGDDSYGNTFTCNFFNNTFGPGCQNNIIGNIVGGGANSDNTYGSQFTNNVIDDNFQFNSIGTVCQDNNLGPDFTNNMIDNTFQSNNIGADCIFNVIASDFISNNIDTEFSFNRFDSGVAENTIGQGFSNNISQTGFAVNTIGDSFQSNSFGSNFVNNIIVQSGVFLNNIITDCSLNITLDTFDFTNNTVSGSSIGNSSLDLNSSCNNVSNCGFNNISNLELGCDVNMTQFNGVDGGPINSPIFTSLPNISKQVIFDSSNTMQVVYLGDNGTFQVTPASV